MGPRSGTHLEQLQLDMVPREIPLNPQTWRGASSQTPLRAGLLLGTHSGGCELQTLARAWWPGGSYSQPRIRNVDWILYQVHESVHESQACTGSGGRSPVAGFALPPFWGGERSEGFWEEKGGRMCGWDKDARLHRTVDLIRGAEGDGLW